METLAVLGCGAVGSALAGALAGSHGSLVLWSRDGARAARLGERLGARGARVSATGDLARALAAPVVVLAVADDALEAFAARCAAEGRPSAGAVALHTNGARPAAALAPMAAAGWVPGKWHPLVALPPEQALERPLAGAWFAVEGAGPAREVAARLVAACDGHELFLRPGERASVAYHAAASLLGGGVVALFDAAAEVLEASAEDPEAARRALASLLASALRNLEAQPPAAALTGAVARGARETVRAHLAALGDHDPATAALYARLGRRMARLAARRGSLDAATLAELEELLGA